MTIQELALKTEEKPRLKQRTRIVYCSCGEAAVEHTGNPSTYVYCPNCGRYQKRTHDKHSYNFNNGEVATHE